MPLPTLSSYSAPAGPSTSASPTSTSKPSQTPSSKTSQSPSQAISETSAQRTLEARRALEASMYNIGASLTHDLSTRAQTLHSNSSALEKQEQELIKETGKLRKETDKLAKEAERATKALKEVGNVQNWAEVLERDFLVLGETLRLVREGSEGSWSGSEGGDGDAVVGDGGGEGKGKERERERDNGVLDSADGGIMGKKEGPKRIGMESYNSFPPFPEEPSHDSGAQGEDVVMQNGATG